MLYINNIIPTNLILAMNRTSDSVDYMQITFSCHSEVKENINIKYLNKNHSLYICILINLLWNYFKKEAKNITRISLKWTKIQIFLSLWNIAKVYSSEYL